MNTGNRMGFFFLALPEVNKCSQVQVALLSKWVLKAGYVVLVCTGMFNCSVPPTGAFCVALHCLSPVSEVVWGWDVASCTFSLLAAGTIPTRVITAQDPRRIRSCLPRKTWS